jgi:H/ACA ribonucleoprotein complex subunit 4
MHSSKEYVTLMELHGDVNLEKLYEVFKMFTGKIYQRPPLRSSVKRSLRVREIYSIDLLEIINRYVLFRVKCESGTYIRKLCHDIGLVLGVEAHMRELRRVAVAHIREELPVVTLHEVSEAVYLWRKYGDETLIRKVVLPVEYIVAHLPKIIIKDSAVDAIAHGAQLAVPGIVMLSNDVKKGERVAIFTLKGELVAIGKSFMETEEIVKNEKGVAVKIERVVMDRGTYPPLWKKAKKEEKSE